MPPNNIGQVDHFFKVADVKQAHLDILEKLHKEKSCEVKGSVRWLELVLRMNYHIAIYNYLDNKTHRVVVLRPWVLKDLGKRSADQRTVQITSDHVTKEAFFLFRLLENKAFTLARSVSFFIATRTH